MLVYPTGIGTMTSSQKKVFLLWHRNGHKAHGGFPSPYGCSGVPVTQRRRGRHRRRTENGAAEATAEGLHRVRAVGLRAPRLEDLHQQDQGFPLTWLRLHGPACGLARVHQRQARRGPAENQALRQVHGGLLRRHGRRPREGPVRVRQRLRQRRQVPGSWY